ncbi:MAG: diaminopimelate decarboxylase [Chloroflexota bacterium]
MSAFNYLDGSLHCDSVPLSSLAAEFGTPLYVYSADRLRENYRRLAQAFAPLRPAICYSVKANANLSILRLLRDEGAGFDIVSGGELFRVQHIGANMAHVVFAGVGKTEAEIEMALRAGVGWINVESEGELRRVNDLAGRLGRQPNVAIRLRPDVEADTHHHISTGSSASKFGVPPAQALELVRAPLPNVHIRGAHIHIGSQLAGPDATLQAIEVALEFVAKAKALGAAIDTLDIGGGFPVSYRGDDPVPDIESFAAPIVNRLAHWNGGLHLEPGRYLVADTAALITTVQYEKDDSARRIIIVDAGMNTLLRPALYDAYHRILPVGRIGNSPYTPADVAGPICESADFLARNRPLPPLISGDLLALLDVGAYGFSMASNYNSHPLPAEVLVEGNTYHLIRRRQTYEELIANEAAQSSW